MPGMMMTTMTMTMMTMMTIMMTMMMMTLMMTRKGKRGPKPAPRARHLASPHHALGRTVLQPSPR
eukprot:1368063-Rhodomonas_salina.3